MNGRPERNPVPSYIKPENRHKWVGESLDECDDGSISKTYHRMRAVSAQKWLDERSPEEKHKLFVDSKRIDKTRERVDTDGMKTRRLQKAFKDWREEAAEEEGSLIKHTWQERKHHLKPQPQNEDEDSKGGREHRDNPAHDFAAGLMYFKKSGSVWKGDTRGREHQFFTNAEKFPGQKISVHKALFDKSERNPLGVEKDDVGLQYMKYFHLPANHMGVSIHPPQRANINVAANVWQWIEQAMARYHNEDKLASEKRKRTNKTLSRENWRGQLHGSGLGKSPVHSRHMRSRCSTIPQGKLETASVNYCSDYLYMLTPMQRQIPCS